VSVRSKRGKDALRDPARKPPTLVASGAKGRRYLHEESSMPTTIELEFGSW
jgi:hypothetical protein